MKKIFILIIVVLVLISGIFAVVIKREALEDRIARMYYYFFPIHIAAEFPDGIQQEAVKLYKEGNKKDSPNYEPSGLILIEPLARIKEAQDTLSNVYFDGICQGYRVNGQVPKGIIIYDKQMHKIGYISVTEIKRRGKLEHFTASVGPANFKKPYKAILDYGL